MDSKAEQLVQLGVADAHTIQANIYAFRVLAEAINAARNPRRFEAAAEALDWLLSQDSYLFMDQLNLGPIIPKVLQILQYKQVFKDIKAAARETPEGRQWLQGPKMYRLEELMRQAEIYFKAQAQIKVTA